MAVESLAEEMQRLINQEQARVAPMDAMHQLVSVPPVGGTLLRVCARRVPVSPSRPRGQVAAPPLARLTQARAHCPPSRHW
jgi:hypothetical protein